MDNVLHPSSQCYTEPFHSIPPILLCLPSNPWQPLISFPILSPAFYLLFYFCLFTALQLIFFLKNSFWTIVGLQCCVSFRCTVKWISYTHTHTLIYVPCHAQLLSHVWLCNPMDCSPPDSFVHGISQGRILEWVVILFRGSSRPRDWNCISRISCIGRRILYHWATWVAICMYVCMYVYIYIYICTYPFLDSFFPTDHYRVLSRVPSALQWFLLVICLIYVYVCVSCSVVSDSLWPHELGPPGSHDLGPTRLLHPWDSPGKKWVGSGLHSLLHILYKVVCMCTFQSPNLSIPPFLPSDHKFFSMSVTLFPFCR